MGKKKDVLQLKHSEFKSLKNVGVWLLPCSRLTKLIKLKTQKQG